jgi:hypothetical protein
MRHLVKRILFIASVGLSSLAPLQNSTPASLTEPRWRLVQSWPPLPSGIRFGILHAVAVDRFERVLILHRGDPPIVRLNRDGTLDRGWGTGMFKEAHGLKIAPDDCIWVTDVARHIIVRFSEEGRRLQMLGTEDQSGEGSDHLGGPADLAFLPNGDFYVADGYLNSRVIKFDKYGRHLFEWGKTGERAAEFQLPHSIAVDTKGRVYVADRGNKRIQVFEPEGKFVTEWRVGTPYGLLFTAGQLWMTDMPAKRVMRIGPTGWSRGVFPDS